MRHLSVLLLLLLPLLPLGAYAAFDDVQVVEPRWTTLPSVPQETAAAVVYRLRRSGPDRVAVELRNGADRPFSAGIRLPAYQDAATPTDLAAAPGQTVVVELAVRRFDCDCNESAVRFEGVRLGEADVAMRAFGASAPPAGERAFAVRTAWESPGFRGECVAYTAAARDARTIDLHVLNRSAQPIHADFLVHGWQPAGAVNPRLHLLPGVATEVLVEGVAVDGRIGAAALTLWAVRVGEDAGPSLGTGPGDDRAFPILEEGWQPVMLRDEGLASVNPGALAQRRQAGRLELRNRSDQAITATLDLLGDRPIPAMAIALEAGAATSLPLPDGAAVTAVLIRDPVLGGVPQRCVPLAIAAPPANALSPLPLQADGRFNPLTVAYAIARLGERQARVTVVNRAAIDLHCAWAIPAYRGAANPRLHLAAGGRAELVVDLDRSDVRLALAQLQVWDVRLGADAGALLCASPAAASP